MSKTIKDILSSLLTTNNDWRLFLLQNWPTIVGNLHEKMRLEKIHDTTLIIGVYDSHWMHELFALSRVILRTINSKLDAPHVQKLHFRLAQQKNLTENIPSAKSKKSNSLAYPSTRPSLILSGVEGSSYGKNRYAKKNLTSAERHALTKIHDTELQEHLKNFLARCIRESY